MPERQDELLRPKSMNPLSGQAQPEFDINHYLEMAKEFEMSEEEKIELLTILWDIMKRFVELGWGLDSVSLLGDEIVEKYSGNERSAVELENNQKTE